MKDSEQIRMTWSIVVRDELKKVLLSLEKAKCLLTEVIHPSGCLPLVGFSDDEIRLVLPALARRFNVALATDDTLRFADDPQFLDVFRRLGAEPVAMLACGWVRCGLGCPPPERAPEQCQRCRCGAEVYFNSPGPVCLRAVRQILGLYGRLLTRYPENEVTAEFRDAFLKRVTDKPNIVLPDRYAEVFDLLLGDTDLSPLQGGDSDVRLRNGPGAVAERYKAWEKENLFFHWEPRYDSLDRSLLRQPFEDVYNGRPAFTALCCDYARVAFVPKDYRGPRVIAAEPALHAYVQQGCDELIRKGIAKSIARYCIDLNDQTVNSRAAQEGSVNGSLATIDLSDASDTVRIDHLLPLERVRPDVFSWLMILRTPRVLVDGKLVELTTFSPMGSSLTFPVETLVFATTIISALWDVVMGKCVPCRKGTMIRFMKKANLHLYGDDIVIDSIYASNAIDSLVLAGFSPNLAKCCVKGFFRESCGVDAVFGQDVTPLRPRYLPGAAERDWSGYKDMIQGFLDRGCPCTALWLWHLCATGPLHVVYPFCSPHDFLGDDLLVDTFGQVQALVACKPAHKKWDRDLQVTMWKSCYISTTGVSFPFRKGVSVNHHFDLCRYRDALRSKGHAEALEYAWQRESRPSLGEFPSDASYPGRVPRLRRKTTWVRAKEAFTPERGSIEGLLNL